MLGFLENVGYAKKSKFCIFNINSMEELKPIVECGAGAISKKFHYGTGRVERIANVKQISDYISRFNEMITRKDYFFSQE